MVTKETKLSVVTVVAILTVVNVVTIETKLSVVTVVAI